MAGHYLVLCFFGSIADPVSRNAMKAVYENRDYQNLCRILQGRIVRRVVPEIRKLFFMEITRMERFPVGCYAAEDGGHFQPHRDNSGGVNAHRRFAVSINLNDDFVGGAVRLPEYNGRGIKAPRAGRWCSRARSCMRWLRVVKGRRYAFLPFMYDEQCQKIRIEKFEARVGNSSLEAGPGGLTADRSDCPPKISLAPHGPLGGTPRSRLA